MVFANAQVTAMMLGGCLVRRADPILDIAFFVIFKSIFYLFSKQLYLFAC